MKHPLLEGLGDNYPVYLEQHHDHVLRKVDELWDTPEIDDYLSDLLIDKRGGRKGFSPEATQALMATSNSPTYGQSNSPRQDG